MDVKLFQIGIDIIMAFVIIGVLYDANQYRDTRYFSPLVENLCNALEWALFTLIVILILFLL
jgi:hypothetical protein